MSRLCLDTSAYSHFARGHSEVVAQIDQADWIGFPSITLGELWLGFLLGQKLEENLETLSEFLAHPVVRCLNVDDETARLYAELVVDLRHAGAPLPTNDIWIAAAALQTRSTVLTFDRHFERTERVPSRILQG